MSESAPSEVRHSRAQIISTIQTPLGFFAMVVLVVEALLAATTALIPEAERLSVVLGMLCVLLFLVLIVAFFAYIRPEALLGQRASVPLVQPSIEDELLRLDEPKILCAATAEYMELGFEKDAALLKQLFGKRVQVVEKLDLEALTSLLATERFDIVHLMGLVDPADGMLVFDPGVPSERLAPIGFSDLLKISETKLVILATCDSIDLGAHLARQTNVVAATTFVGIDQFMQWASCFYRLLAGGQNLSSAYETSRAASVAPMVLLMKKDLRVS